MPTGILVLAGGVGFFLLLLLIFCRGGKSKR